MFTAVGALAIAIWPALAGGGGAASRGAVSGVRATAIASIVSLALFAWLIAETFGGAELGAAERATSALQTCWPFVVVLAARLAPQQYHFDPQAPALDHAR